MRRGDSSPPRSPDLGGPCSTQQGFLYVEVLVALLILEVALLAALPMMVLATRELTASRDYTLATIAAHEKAEALKTADFDTLSGGQDTLTLHSLDFERHWEVDYDAPQPGMKTVSVTVVAERVTPSDERKPTLLRFYRAH